MLRNKTSVALRLHLANGTRTTYAYDDSGKVTAVVHQKSDATTITRFDYAYDAAGNRTSVLEWGGDRVTWTYDDADQLTRERRSGANAYDTTFTYDAAGKRLVKIEDGAGVTTYTYEAAGKLHTLNVVTLTPIEALTILDELARESR